MNQVENTQEDINLVQDTTENIKNWEAGLALLSKYGVIKATYLKDKISVVVVDRLLSKQGANRLYQLGWKFVPGKPHLMKWEYELEIENE